MIATFITSSMLIISVMVIRKLFMKKILCRVQYALWFLVAARLILTPVFPVSSNFSILNYLGNSHSSIESDNTSVPASYVLAEQNSNEEITESKKQNLSNSLTQTATSAVSRDKLGISIKSVITMVWIAGTAIIIVYTLVYNLRVFLLFRKRRMIYDGYKCSRKIYLLEGIKSPCLFMGNIYARDYGRRRKDETFSNT